MEIEKLLLEIQKLKEENARLKVLLKNNNINYEEKESEVYLSKEEKLLIYKSYFRGRTDVFTEKYVKKDGKKGYAKVCINRFSSLCDYQKYKQCKECPNEVFRQLNDEAIMQHLFGEKSFGIYPIFEKNFCYFLAIDFDDDLFKKAALAYKKECEKIGIDSIIELSQSGEGAHVWIFFDNKINAKKARLLGDYILTQAIQNNKDISFKSYDRFFPAQDFVDEKGYGNCIALPLQGKCVKYKKTSLFVDDLFVPYINQIAALKKVKKLSELELDIIFKEFNVLDSTVELNQKNIKKCNLMKSDFSSMIEIVIKNDIFVNKNGLSNKAINNIKRLAVLYNPDFYEKQAKRISTYNIERIIELYKEEDNYISLPRGCYDDLIYLLKFIGISYEIKDKRIFLNDINVSFNALLKENQEQAVMELLKYDNGLLVAETGSGKTIMGMNVIYRIHKPTLILVEKIKLHDQWKERIKEYMNFDAGEYYGSKKKLTGIIDIASIKSLNESNNLYDKYEVIICDEVHHIASVTYENVIRLFNAKHVYGFTATPNRSDHLEKIVYKCISPIRSTLEKKKTSFLKMLKPKFTKFKNKKEFDLIPYSDLCKELFKSDIRNQQIIDDVMLEYANNKKILILTERNEHIDILYGMLKDKCNNLFKINGIAKTRDKKDFANKIKEIKENYIIISTGKYLGEGFDLPSLDTLFLTMPFKWKGMLSQYVGRIQREIEGKERIIVYDYVDIKCGKFSHQFQLRLKEYKKEGFDVESINEKSNLIYTYNNYKTKLFDDIENAKKIKLMFNYCKENIIKQMLELNNNIEIITDCNIDIECKIVRNHSDLNIVVIDDKIMWYGSINPFIYASKEDTILRIEDSEYVKEIMDN